MAVAYLNSQAQLGSYRSNSVMGASPAQLVLKSYDLALAALRAEDGPWACKVLAQLIESLDFRYQEVALGFFRLYRYCMEEIKQGRLGVPTRILRELRDTWAQAMETAEAVSH